jgi:MFS transporter, FSR family, fosmidomycin resistance protein
VQNNKHHTSHKVHRTSYINHRISNNIQPIFWGILHGLNDFAAGFMLAHFTFHNNSSTAVIYLVIYSVIGFGGQLPVGFLMDYKRQLKPFAFASILLLPIAVTAYFFNPQLAIILSGVASAFVHVTGGAVCLLTENKNKITPLSLFTAPGVLGLTIGGLLGQYDIWQLYILLGLILAAGFFIFKSNLPEYTAPQKKESELDAHDWVMLLLLLFMCFRSFIFDVINQVSYEHENGILIIGISAFLGKIIGGIIADKIGWKKYVFITLPIAFILFQFGKENIYALAFGIACMQSSVPITLLLMSRNLPIYPATATALSLGASVAIAGLPLFLINDKQHIFKQFNNGWLTAVFFTLLIIGAYVTLRFFSKRKTFIAN